MEFPHVLDISVLCTGNLQLLFVSYYKIVMYLSNQSKDQALSVKNGNGRNKIQALNYKFEI